MYTLIFTVAVLATGQIVEIEDEDKFIGKPACQQAALERAPKVAELAQVIVKTDVTEIWFECSFEGNDI